MRDNTSMKAESANKLVKISTVIKVIYGDYLHKKRQLSINGTKLSDIFV